MAKGGSEGACDDQTAGKRPVYAAPQSDKDKDAKKAAAAPRFLEFSLATTDVAKPEKTP